MRLLRYRLAALIVPLAAYFTASDIASFFGADIAIAPRRLTDFVYGGAIALTVNWALCRVANESTTDAGRVKG